MSYKNLAVPFFVFIFLLGCGGMAPVSNVRTAENAQEPTGELVFKEDEELQKEIASIANEAKGKVGVFALLMEENRAVSLNGKERFAMQSVVKLPVAMAVMKQVGEGKLTLEQKINFTPDDLVNPNQRSPLRDKNPNGGSATVEELIRLAVSESDGSACGSPAAPRHCSNSSSRWVLTKWLSSGHTRNLAKIGKCSMKTGRPQRRPLNFSNRFGTRRTRRRRNPTIWN